MSGRAVEFNEFDIGNFKLRVGDLLIINGNICYLLKIVISDYHGKMHLTCSVPGIKQTDKKLTFEPKKFLYQLEDGTIKLFHGKKNQTS